MMMSQEVIQMHRSSGFGVRRHCVLFLWMNEKIVDTYIHAILSYCLTFDSLSDARSEVIYICIGEVDLVFDAIILLLKKKNCSNTIIADYTQEDQHHLTHAPVWHRAYEVNSQHERYLVCSRNSRESVLLSYAAHALFEIWLILLFDKNTLTHSLTTSKPVYKIFT